MLERRLMPSEDFPLLKDQPLSPSEVVEKIGTFRRQVATHNIGRTDFPQPVLVVTKERAEIRANLTGIFADTASQSDGTFYFDRDVRRPEGIRATNFLWGREINMLTLLSDKEAVPPVRQGNS